MDHMCEGCSVPIGSEGHGQAPGARDGKVSRLVLVTVGMPEENRLLCLMRRG